MKKLFSLFAAVLMAVGMWAQDPDWSVTSFSGSISNNALEINDATLTFGDFIVGAGTPTVTISSNKLKFGSSKSVFWSSYTISTDAFNSYNVTKVEVGCYDNGGTESAITVKQGNVTIGTAQVSTNTTSNVETLNTTQGEGGTLKITFTSTKQASYITSIKVWYTLGGDAVHVESVSLDQHTLTVMATKKATLTATIAPANATNQNVSWESSDPDVATVEKGVVKGVSEGEATITVKTADGNKTDQCVVTVTPKTAPADAAFYESFDELNGAGGNDGTWSGISGTYAWSAEDCDNEDWTTEGTMNMGAQCASIRKNDNAASGLTTPAIGVAGKGNVTFNAQSWGTDTGDFYVDIVGGGTFTAASGVTLSNNNTTAKVTLTKKSEWGDYDLAFTGLTSTSKFRFYMAKGKRGFLDEVAVWVEPKKWDGTVSLSKTEFRTLADLEGLTLTFNDATAVTLAEEPEYISFQNEDGSKMYAIWNPNEAYGGTYIVDGNTIKLYNWSAQEALPAVDCSVYFEDYGTFSIDGVEDYFDTYEASYIAPTPTTYTVTYTVTGFEAEHCFAQAGYFDEAETVSGYFEEGENTVPENVSAYVRTVVLEGYVVKVKVNGEAVTLTNGQWYSDGPITDDMTIEVVFRTTATAVENIEAVKATKVVKDGQVMIIRDSKTYNVMGMQL